MAEQTADLEAIDDPFEWFNRQTGSGVVDDPWTVLAEVRREGPPIQKADLARLMGFEQENRLDADESDDESDDEGPGLWAAVTFEGAERVLRDGQTFSSTGYEDVMGPVMGHSILEMDEPEHRTYRGLVQKAFSRKAMERWSTELVASIVDEHIDECIDEGRADLVKQVTFPFPVNVIAALLGLAREDLGQFHRWAVELIGWGFDPERGLAASSALYDYFDGIIEACRKNPGEDVISVLTQAELDGHTLTNEEIIAFLRLLLPAGAETTYRSSSNLLFGLLTHTDQLDAVRNDRSLLPQAIEEGLRWEPPLLWIPRWVAEDVELWDQQLAAGDTVTVALGSANHDETRWENPEAFDIFREPQQHLAFAFGPHMCLGMHLARMETMVVLNKVLDRLPDLRIDPDADEPYITGMTFRAPPSLPVVWG